MRVRDGQHDRDGEGGDRQGALLPLQRDHSHPGKAKNIPEKTKDNNICPQNNMSEPHQLLVNVKRSYELV